MKKRFVLPADHHSSRPPLWSSVVLFMALDLYEAPGWAWGVAGTLWAIFWIVWVWSLVFEESKPLDGYGSSKDN